MALSAPNESWVRGEIDSAISKALKGITPPSGFRRAVFFLREWSICLGVVPALICALGASIVSLIIAVTNRREADAVFHTKTIVFQEATTKQLDQIQATLLSLRAKAVVANPPIPPTRARQRTCLLLQHRIPYHFRPQL